jgi:hypothetical protein
MRSTVQKNFQHRCNLRGERWGSARAMLLLRDLPDEPILQREGL